MQDLKVFCVLVFGFVGSARAAVWLAVAKGARVSVVPAGPEPVSNRDIEALENLGAETLKLGAATKADFDVAVLSQQIPRTSEVVYPLIEKNVPVISDLEFASQHFLCLGVA